MDSKRYAVEAHSCLLCILDITCWSQ